MIVTMAPRVWLCLVTLVLCCWYADETLGAGLKVSLTQLGLNYAAKVGCGFIHKKLNGLRLPNQSGKKIFEYSVKNMKVHYVTKPTSTVTINPGRGLTWKLSIRIIRVEGRWFYRKWFIKDSGSFKVWPKNIRVSVSITAKATRDGVMAIRETRCVGRIGSIKIRLSGGASWLYNLFHRLTEKLIRPKLEGKICDAVRSDGIYTANRELRTMPVSFQFGPKKQWLLDYSLSSIVFAPGYLQASLKGKFSIRGDSTEAPFQPSSLSSPPPTQSRMVTFWISDYVFNTAAYAVHKSGMLQYTLTRNALPNDQKDRFNTTCSFLYGCLGIVMPQVGEKYPGSFIEVEASTTESPIAIISKQNINVVFVGSLAFRARLQDDSLVDLFNINAVLNVSLVLRFEERAIKATVSSVNQTMTLGNSSVGSVNVQLMQFVIDIIKKQFIIPKLNEAIKRGLPIPATKNVKLLRPQLLLGKNYVQLSTNVKYKA